MAVVVIILLTSFSIIYQTYTSENKKYFFEIKTVSRMMCQQKVRKQEFCDSVCYKIPYFIDDSCELRILHDSVTVCVAKFL